MNRRASALVCAGILLAAGGVTTVIFFTEPTAQRVAATKETAMLVDVTTVRRDTYRPTIVAMGTVRPARDVLLQPRVEGEVVERAPSFEPGGFVEKGERLLSIDPSDYENVLRQRASDLRRAEADLEMEMGRQEIAQQDYELIDRELSPENRALVLRDPQLETARATVEAARAAVAQAELRLRRTSVEAPFDAHVLTREVDVGSRVSPGDPLGRLVGLDTYWVVTTVPLSKLRWIAFPDEPGGPGGSEARVRSPAAWPADEFREGSVARLVGALEEDTRLARVLVTVDDPLAYRAESPGTPALMIGAFVEVHVRAKAAEDVVRLDRAHVRKGDTAWVMEDGELRIRDLVIDFEDERYAYVSSGLEDGDRVVTTHLTTVVDGAPLRLEGPEPADTTDPPEEAGG